MIRTLHIFDLFRHTRAERALRACPFVLTRIARDGGEIDVPTPSREVHIQWRITSEKRLVMSWTTDGEGGTGL